MTRRLRLAGCALLVVGSAAIAAPASSTSAPVCSTADSAFCTSFDYSVTDATTDEPTTTAATPMNLRATIANTSTNVATDKSLWWQTLSLTTASTSSTAPVLTASASMPDKLLVAGTRNGINTCTSPYDGTKCPAGWGTARVDVSGLPCCNGIYAASFGIMDIHNNRFGGDATHQIALVADVDLTVSGLPLIGDYTMAATVPIRGGWSTSSGTSASSTGPVTLTIPVVKAGDSSVGSYSFHYDASLESVQLALRGRSNETTTATLASATTVITAPRGCGTDAATISATDRGGASVSQPEAITFTGCPTETAASGKALTQPFAATFSASASAGVRAINHYEWTFGDGSKASTSTPRVTHTFGSRGTATASVVAVDGMGARSAPMKVTLRRTSTRGAQVVPTRIAGRSTVSSGSLAGRTVTLRKCTTVKTAFLSCRVVASRRLTTGAWTFTIPRPGTTVHYAVVLVGSGTTVGSAIRINATPRG